MSFAAAYTKSGMKDLALQYHIQCQIFENWGDHHNLRTENPEDCSLQKESDRMKKILLETVLRIRELHQEARNYIEIHGSDVTFPDIVDTSSVQKAFSLPLDGDVAKGRAQETRALKKRMLWAIKNRDCFTGVISKLRSYNQDLLDLTGATIRDSLVTTLPGRVLASIMNPVDLARLAQGPSSEVAHAAKLKALKISLARGTITTPYLIAEADLQFPTELAPISGARSFGIYSLTQRIWVEWTNLSGVLESHVPKLLNRTRTLSTILDNTSTEILGTGECIGVVEENHRIGLVFKSTGGYPTSLSQIIERSSLKLEGAMPVPPLGHKFELAKRLASSLAMLHYSNWLHKAFRSDNILFLGSEADVDTLRRPLVAGFENSREVHMESLGNRPDGSGSVDYFYHPNVVHGFDKSMDLYSFGIVLLEIAYWTPLRDKITRSKNKPKSLDKIQEIFMRTAREKLPSLMGRIYAGVVTLCLERKLATTSDEELTCSMTMHVISQLDQCRV
ncbi:hypothetical protein GQ53DRAFT_841507 [Thozetella sp. PMI_491]|nr:hypothetical protein GQ53DRAFT_841507 [Thozetella sp. PMI_491]